MLGGRVVVLITTSGACLEGRGRVEGGEEGGVSNRGVVGSSGPSCEDCCCLGVTFPVVLVDSLDLRTYSEHLVMFMCIVRAEDLAMTVPHGQADSPVPARDVSVWCKCLCFLRM